MQKLFVVFFLAAASFGGFSACAQSVDDLRADRILENLKHEFPQLQDIEVEMQALEPTDVSGLSRGSFLIGGQQTQEFLITDDDQLYLVAAGPIDVGRTEEELAALQAEARAAEAAEALRRQAELEELAAGQPVRGNPEAPVLIVEFSDFQCPYCQRAAATVDELLEKRDDVRLVYLHFPLPNHPWARPAAIASACAANQDDDAFWTLHDAYFENQRQLSPTNVIARSRDFLAGQTLDMEVWKTCAEDETSAAHQEAAAFVDAATELGRQLGVTGTPGFFVNGHYLNGAKPLEDFEAVVEQAKASAQ